MLLFAAFCIVSVAWSKKKPKPTKQKNPPQTNFKKKWTNQKDP